MNNIFFLPVKYSISIQYKENKGCTSWLMCTFMDRKIGRKWGFGGCFFSKKCMQNKVQYLFALNTYHNCVFDPHHSYPHSHYHHHRSMLLGYIFHHHIWTGRLNKFALGALKNEHNHSACYNKLTCTAMKICWGGYFRENLTIVKCKREA